MSSATENEVPTEKPPVSDDVRAYLTQIARMTSDKKKVSSSKNGHLGGRPTKPLSEIPCTCGRADNELHPTTCPRGRAQRRRGEAVAQ